MNKTGRIFIFLLLLIFGANMCYSQTVSIKADTIQKDNTSSKTGAKKQNRLGQRGDGSGTVKQVNGARPDMSKARGARPPDIVRPSGSGIPRGMGKPGGARRRGGI